LIDSDKIRQMKISGIPRTSILRKERPIITFGVFDEMHRGQRWLIRRMVARANEIERKSALLLVRPRPMEALGLSEKRYLSSVSECVYVARMLGVDYVGTINFTSALALTQAPEFLSQIKQRLNPSELWLGENATIGRGAEGTRASVTRTALNLDIITNYIWSEANEVIFELQSAFDQGDMASVAALRGSSFAVVAGVQSNITNDSPNTIHLVFPEKQRLPPEGWYEVRSVAVDSSHHFSPSSCFLQILVKKNGLTYSTGRMVVSDTLFKLFSKERSLPIRLEFLSSADKTLIRLFSKDLEISG
jgi:FAD synthase